MKKYTDLLLDCPLFHGFDARELDELLGRLSARERHCPAGAAILLTGEPADRVGILLEGRAQVIREGFSGSRTIVTELAPGDLFAEAFACASGGEKTLPVTVLSVTESVVLLLDYRGIVAARPGACPSHARLIENMLAVLAGKNLLLNRRLGHLSRRTTREKLLSYLSEQAAAQGSAAFRIPFDRQQLADYLCVDRSAMSAVLSDLRREGILETSRSRFLLKGFPDE